MLVERMEVIVANLFQMQASAVPADRMAIFGMFARRLYASRMEKAQMRFAPTSRMSFCND